MLPSGSWNHAIGPTSSRRDTPGVVLELVVAGELDAGGGEFVDDPVEVVDVPDRHCRRSLPAVMDWYTFSAGPPPAP